jgi:hypothetical protein
MAVKLGLHIAATDWAGGPRQLGSKLAEIVQATEAASFDAVSVVDHVWQSHYLDGPEESEIEGYTTLGFIAAHTRRVRLLTLATCAAYRPAGLLGKMVTTLDVLSDGRMMLGIGAGDYAEEAAGLGLPFPKTGERFEIMEETVQACLRMWQGEHGSDEPFQGRHVRMERPDAETWTAALGVSDLQHGMPMRPDLHMRIGSITKSVLEASVSSSLWRSLFVVPPQRRLHLAPRIIEPPVWPPPLEPQRLLQQPTERGMARRPPPVLYGEVQGLLLADDHDELAGAGQRRVEQGPAEHRGVAGDQRDHDGRELGALSMVARSSPPSAKGGRSPC